MKPFRRADHVLNETGPVKTDKLVRGRSRPYFNAMVISGMFLVFRNVSGYNFLPDFIIFPDIGHLSTVMLYLMVAPSCLVTKNDYTTALQRHMNKG
ncbi:MAG: hypothetical protein JRJ43_03160 [Deltaproteobacteria bacterium]|nr:hypothetical protein [Deltaproteobacteria bacterium]MBW1718548.1 hypothetical protein [Deltaproteobacteria bacterium]MBW1931709.1 hypothetical protein [Deltaproteobacteria bacterium]MBW1937296.1 hypothetical protein [Deltaproteobacteria bacterium]MBW1964367.1 hypothetical protein [Deltaproteobacteria bacterium]